MASMAFADLFAGFVASSVTIFVIMDPVASIAPFIHLTKGFSDDELKKTAVQAVAIAGAVAIGFLLFGPPLLSWLGITLKDFRVAGGIILGLLSLEMVLGISFHEHEGRRKDTLNAVAALIATPMLTGPGLMSSVILLAQEYGYLTVVFALFPALVASWLVLGNAPSIKKILGEQPLEILSRVMGLVLLAFAISFIRAGV